MLTRKHFNDIARHFASLPFESTHERNVTLDSLCVILAQMNPSFNRIRFVNAATCMPMVQTQ